MSLILDALRKSEHQRQRHSGPGFAVVPEAAERQRPATWVLVLGGLLALNILVLAALLLSDRREAPTAAAPPPEAPARAAATAPRPKPVTLPARPRREDVRPLATETASSTAAAAVAGTPGGPATEPRQEAAPSPAVAPAGRDTATADARLPRFADLVVRGELAVPDMHLDIHVYSGNAAERFVFINMRKYVEGQATQEGPRVERITGEGVIMDHQGKRFLLSRD